MISIADGQLVLSQEPVPEPGPDQVLIHVRAAGVNRADLLQRRGLHPPPPGAPAWPGLEISGTIAAVGTSLPDPSVTPTNSRQPATQSTAQWKVGDQVCALLDGGGYAEYAVADAGQVLPLPVGLPLEDAAALPEAAATVYSNLINTTGLSSTGNHGRTVLVHGGSGGIGVFAIQFLRATGAVVFATAGSAERVRRCEELGAYGINHRTEDFVRLVREATADRGADVILDVVGAAYLQRNIATLAPHGHLAIIGMQKGTTAEIDLAPLLSRWLTIGGTGLRQRPAVQKRQIIADLRREVWPLIERGDIQTVIGRRAPLEAAATVHDELANSQVFGKAILINDHPLETSPT